ncbi:MAG: sugar transferase, partial [Thermoleophilia bacterium]|nr:sugar transferase [Thermoleophilia bacterium]
MKRGVDLVVSAVGLLVLAIPFALIALAIRLDSPGPAFFRQERVGRGGRLFRVWKFRTMVKDAERIGLGMNVRADDDRITRVGRFLRDWGFDELPQLINVLRGDMSLVGPRPTVPAQVALYTDFERRRLEVKPGITGWALIHGRNAISWDERIRYDVWYVDHWSFWL